MNIIIIIEFENCGLQEMNASEMKSVDGGWFGPFGIGVQLARIGLATWYNMNTLEA